MIDIIIPAYNAHDTIYRCISSIVFQTYTDYYVTIVNDGGEGYQDIIDKYNKIINIREISYKDNKGPGYARQYGVDNTNKEYIMFIDADDTLYTPFALKYLIQGIESNKENVVCSANFLEESLDREIIHNEDMVWMFGKIYKRKFLNKYNIRFCPGSRWNEDNGFNTYIRLCENDNEKIHYISEIVYCWHENPNSITRKDNNQYTYDKSFVGYIENMIWAIKQSKKHRDKKDNDIIDIWSLNVLMNIYQYLIEAIGRDKRFLKQAWAWSQVYFDEIISPIKNKFNYDLIAAEYTEVIRNAYDRGSMNGIIPSMTLNDFLYRLENRLDIIYDECDISDYYPNNSMWLILK